jgi:hypothetical protein
LAGGLVIVHDQQPIHANSVHEWLDRYVDFTGLGKAAIWIRFMGLGVICALALIAVVFVLAVVGLELSSSETDGLSYILTGGAYGYVVGRDARRAGFSNWPLWAIGAFLPAINVYTVIAYIFRRGIHNNRLKRSTQQASTIGSTDRETNIQAV